MLAPRLRLRASYFQGSTLLPVSVLNTFQNFPKPIDISPDEYEGDLGKEESRLLLILSQKVSESGEIGELRRGEK